MAKFKLVSEFSPRGDQGEAIKSLTEGIKAGKRFQTLLGVTGSGKTYTIANLIERVGLPTLVFSHNKTLAAQLYGEFKTFFPYNAVEFFISYYDYYQPEAYLPQKDLYIEKDSDINEEIDRLRLRATSSLIERTDVIIVASVSCIYGLGSPAEYEKLHVIIEVGHRIERNQLLRRLVDILYSRNDFVLERGTFRVRGDVVEIMPAYDDQALRVEFFGDEIEAIKIIDPVSGKVVKEKERAAIYPAKHFVTTFPRIEEAVQGILKEMEECVRRFKEQGKFLEAQRLESRTLYDMEMLQEIGYVSGIENYSRHLTGRKPGQPPWVLLDYFPEECLLVIDESHATIPQIRGMFNGDLSRKKNLVEYGFRLPSALDNRPLNFEEFEKKIHQCIFVSATPADYELEKTGGEIVEQVIRPTGLLDPVIIVKPVEGQVDDLLEEIRLCVEKNERVLVTTLTKKMAEDLAGYINAANIKGTYLHSEINALDRVSILRDLRLKEFDVLVGVNLLREGLDLPEVSLVAILDADKEGFLRSERSLIQTAGRAARNVNGTVIMYAYHITESMRKAIEETNKRRAKQKAYNKTHGITPETIQKSIDNILMVARVADKKKPVDHKKIDILELMDHEEALATLKKRMKEASDKLDFEKAAELRDEILCMDGKLNGLAKLKVSRT